MSTTKAPSRLSSWLALAIASGTCAAINGVFAKLTTTALTTSWSHALSASLSLSPDNVLINFLLRSFFFGLNIAFNILMWTLFTAALTRASSTTRVSIINVSANFMVTAVLGAMIFGERLNGRWWIGAALLAVGNVVIGRREEGEEKKAAERLRDGVLGGGEREGGEQETLLERDENATVGEGEEEVADIIDLGDEDLVGKTSKDSN